MLLTEAAKKGVKETPAGDVTDDCENEPTSFPAFAWLFIK